MRPRCYYIEAVIDIVRWYAVCIAWGMLNMLTAPALTLMFLIVVVGLGTAFIWMFWEVEQISRLRRMSRPHRKGDGIG